MSEFPRSPEAVTGPWLTDRLRECGALKPGATVEEHAMTVLGQGAGMAGIVVRIALRHDADDAGPDSVIAKFSTTNQLNLDLMSSFDLYRREVSFYQDIAPQVAARRPEAYFTEVTEDGRACVLLLEDFPNHRVGDQAAGCSVADAESCIIEVAKLHATFWAGQAPKGLRPYRGVHGDVTRHTAMSVWDEACTRFPHAIPDHIRELREPFFAAGPRLHDWIMEGPNTIAHGDFRLDNLLFGGDGSADPVVLLDWQAPLWSRGMQDVSYLLTQSLAAGDRRRHEQELLERYVAELAMRDVTYSIGACWNDYRVFSLCNFAVAIMIAGALDPTNERARAFMQATIERAAVAFTELELADVLATFSPSSL